MILFCVKSMSEIYVLYVWGVGGRDGFEHGKTQPLLLDPDIVEEFKETN